MNPLKKIQKELRQVAPKKYKHMIGVTEDEYDAHREELEKIENKIIFVDDYDRRCWIDAQWHRDIF